MIKSFEESNTAALHRLAPRRPLEPLLPPIVAPREVAETAGKLSHSIHAAIIMDGSGRWAKARGLPRSEGHRAGVDAVRRVVRAAPDLGIGTLTLHSFSSDNWQRPADEVRKLMSIFERYLRTSLAEWADAGIKTSVTGRRDRLDPSLLAAIEAAETATLEGTRLHLRLAIDYSAREAILGAARLLVQCDASTPAQFAGFLGTVAHDRAPSPDLDLLIRTGGEQRLSDFMLWECAYAELVFMDRLWPDFDGTDLEWAVREFRSRHRRFGRVPETVPAGT